MSALSLTSVTGIGSDKKLEEEKKKTEAERLKNGKNRSPDDKQRSTVRIKDLDKLNLVKFAYGGSILGSRQFAPAAPKMTLT